MCEVESGYREVESSRIMSINSSRTDELSRKHSLRNGIADVPLKFKRHKGSLRRDFPYRCGRLVQRTGPGETAVANGGVEIGTNSVATGGPVATKLPSISTPEPLKFSVKAELSNSVETLKPKSAKLQEDLDKLNFIKTMEAVESLAKALKPQTMKPFETFHQVESLEPMKSREQIPVLLPKAELLDISTSSTQPQTASSLGLKLLRESVLPEFLELPKTPDDSQLSFAFVKGEPKDYPSERRMWATRYFLSETSKIQHVSGEGHPKVFDIPKNMSMNDENPIAESKETVTDKKSQELAVVNEEYPTREDMPSEEKFRDERSKELDTSLVTFADQPSSDKVIHDKVETDMSEEMVVCKKTRQLAVVNERYAIRKDMTAKEAVRDQRSKELDVSLNTFSVQPFNDKFMRERVKETLHMFQVIYKQILHDQRANPQDGRPMKPIYLLVADRLKKEKKWVNAGMPIFGLVPGIEVGDEFHFRAQLSIVGLHRHFQSGIDYTKEDGKILALSIVATGHYDDDELDKSDVLVFSGQGGRPMGGHKPTDQKLERGNLSLKNSMDAGSVVRVIRGFKQANGPHYLDPRIKSFSKFIYDGLYLVEKYWKSVGLHGASIFKFQLRRIPGQPKLAWTELNKFKISKVYEDTCVFDISLGKEKFPIRAVNNVDDEKPLSFTYTAQMIYSKWYNPAPHRGCDCTDGCLDHKRCFCAMKNGGEIPFNSDGAILEMKPLIHECGPSCKCPPSCWNRVSQHGLKFPLEIFKTKSRGWGVRSPTSIACGSFICEYAGEMLQDKEAEERTNNDEYLFDIGRNYNGPINCDEPLSKPDLQMSSCDIIEDVGFTIDAAFFGNIGRFINHSCSPNLYAQNVLYDHDDDKIPHIMLFASEDIPPLQELAYDYNYKIDQVHDAEGNIKKKTCYCGSSSCSGRLY